MLALARNIPQAHASLTPASGSAASSAAPRSTARRSACSASAASASSSRSAPAPSACACRVRPVRQRRALPRARRREGRHARRRARAGDFLTLHLPKTPETQGFINSETLAKCKDGVRIINVARGPLVVDEDLKAAIDDGKVAGAALDVFTTEPITDHPLFGYPNVVVTPHLGACTAEAQDRAGVQTAEQVVAALTGGVVSTAVNIPAVSAEDMEVLGPFIPLAQRLGRIAAALAEPASTGSRSSTWAGSPSATPACSRSPCSRACSPGAPRRRSTWSTRPPLAEERGITVSERTRDQRARLHRPRAGHARRGDERCGSSARRSASCTARTCWRPGASASTSRSTIRT